MEKEIFGFDTYAGGGITRGEDGDRYDTEMEKNRNKDFRQLNINLGVVCHGLF